MFQHFRGNLDSWDPALIDALAAGRRVITFDYAGSLDRLQTVLNQSGFRLEDRDGNFVLSTR